MTVKELELRLSNCQKDAKLKIIQEEELECMPEIWDDEKKEVCGKAKELFSEDCHSQQMYLLAIEN